MFVSGSETAVEFHQPGLQGSCRAAFLLADTYTLYLKTHNYHWNVTGPMFNTLHLMFEDQYNELSIAVDLIAERIRSLGRPAPGSYAQFAELTRIAEPDPANAARPAFKQACTSSSTLTLSKPHT